MALVEELDVMWSLKPITIWLKIIGIDLKGSMRLEKTFSSISFILYGLFLFLLDVSISTASFELANLKWTNSNNALVLMYSFKFDHVVSVIQCSMPHLLLLHFSHQFWKETHKLIRNIEFEFRFQRHHLLRMRKMSTVAVFSVVFMVSMNKKSIRLETKSGRIL